ncbi:MAG: bifunctional UDP-N-acetylmuramoyl-tripeptide:D-alanyl-D-alanine ligase/alanine racemase [Paludibacteraceae bacterium]|nr:bifunctional UDP-N-acetylmuramoyl-tripeptide:D-alanyl-D-alanine ligase/alanine racemase [Paludibacteraceae bacterium]
MLYSSSDIAKIVGGQLFGREDLQISHVLTDSRLISFPEESMFIALKTGKNDGHRYIEDLYKNNVRCFMISASAKEFARLKDATFIVVEDTLAALQAWARHHRESFSIPIIGITGSNGKTIVKEWLYQLLNKDYKITRSPRSYNSQIGVPLSILQLDQHSTLGIFEAGISLPNEMSRLQSIIQPTIGIYTNLGEAHQENFSSAKVKGTEKAKLFQDTELVIYNKEQKLSDICLQQTCKKSTFLSFGTGSNADIVINKKETKATQTTITYTYSSQQSSFSIPFVDDASVENALHCLAVMLYLKISREEIAKRMLQLESVAMRMEVKEGERGCIVVNDSYNSDYNSLSIALDFLSQQASNKQIKKTLFLSDILQSGMDAKELYGMVAKLVKEKGVDRFIGIGKELSKHIDLIQVSDKYVFLTTESFLQDFDSFDFENEAILLKGAREYHFEEISDKLSKVVHETTLEVDLAALVHNFNYFRSFLKPTTKLMSMVKANAYGSGDIEVAKTLQNNGCDYLAVAVADEGAILRHEGIHLPIEVMNPEPNSFPKIFENHLEPEIYSFALLEKIMKEAEKMGVSDYPIHIKIDTGMHRLGFELKDLDRLIEILKGQNYVKIRSVFSHLVGSDSAQFDDFTRQQIAIFTEAKDKITAAFPHKILVHILNSAGIERFSEYQFDMVRLGIGHYGMSAVQPNVLEEVCTLKTKILQLRRVAKEDTIGYSRKGTLTRDSLIGAIPIGYADGLNRKLGNRAWKVLVNGVYAPIVGNVCMDVCMIDLTDVPNVKEGDTVTIFGKGNSIQNMADLLGTISYEILSTVSRRVKRVYFRE